MKRPAKLSVAMIVRDAESQIERSLKSVGWADEICVADTGSADKTPEVAGRLGTKLIGIDFDGFGKAKQEAVQMTGFFPSILMRS